MGYNDLIETFQSAKVVDFNKADDWDGPDAAYRLRSEYDDEESLADRLALLLDQPGADKLTHLIIGAWNSVCEGDSSEPIATAVVEAAPKLPALQHLFFGEMTYEECEISWINQCDVSPLIKAFPKLESFRVRGGTKLSFSKIQHDTLRELAVETGGLPRSAIREIFLCDFPAIDHLELLLGEENYGFDGGVEDLQPLLSGRLYPKLNWLGLMNSEIEDEIAAVVVNSPIVSRLKTLDLSMGNLSSEGVKSLEALAAFPNLETLNISHHYATEDNIAALKGVLKCNVIAEDRQETDEEWRFILHAE